MVNIVASIKKFENKSHELISREMNPHTVIKPAKDVRKYFKQAFEKAKKPQLQSYILGNWGLFELMHNELKAARAYFKSAIRVDLELNDQIALDIDTANLDAVFYNKYSNNSERSQIYLKHAEDIFGRVDDIGK